jgi:hypothetical protein
VTNGLQSESQHLVAGLLCCVLCQCARNDQKEAERYIVESERQWAESVATGDPSTVKRILGFGGMDAGKS